MPRRNRFWGYDRLKTLGVEMKKSLSILVIAALVICAVFSGCSKEKETITVGQFFEKYETASFEKLVKNPSGFLNDLDQLRDQTFRSNSELEAISGTEWTGQGDSSEKFFLGEIQLFNQKASVEIQIRTSGINKLIQEIPEGYFCIESVSIHFYMYDDMQQAFPFYKALYNSSQKQCGNANEIMIQGKDATPKELSTLLKDYRPSDDQDGLKLSAKFIKDTQKVRHENGKYAQTYASTRELRYNFIPGNYAKITIMDKGTAYKE